MPLGFGRSTVRLMRVVVRLVAVTLFVGVSHIASAPPAFACSCVAISDPAAAVANADAAFVGRLVEIRERTDAGRNDSENTGRMVENRFEVEAVIKGEIAAFVVVVAPAGGSSCGLEIGVGERAGLLLRREAEQWQSSLCSKIHPDTMLALATLPRTGSPEPFANSGTVILVGALGLAAVSAFARRRAASGSPPPAGGA